MEEIFNSLKNFIEEKLPEKLNELQDEKTPLPPPAKILFGVADASRIEAKCTCVIVPDTLSEDDPELVKAKQYASLSVAFICQKNSYEVLVRQMCRYAKALRNAIRKDYTLNGKVLNVEIGNTNFFPNTGAVDGTMTACETELTIYENEKAIEKDPFI